MREGEEGREGKKGGKTTFWRDRPTPALGSLTHLLQMRSSEEKHLHSVEPFFMP